MEFCRTDGALLIDLGERTNAAVGVTARDQNESSFRRSDNYVGVNCRSFSPHYRKNRGGIALFVSAFALFFRTAIPLVCRWPCLSGLSPCPGASDVVDRFNHSRVGSSGESSMSTFFFFLSFSSSSSPLILHCFIPKMKGGLGGIHTS